VAEVHFGMGSCNEPPTIYYANDKIVLRNQEQDLSRIVVVYVSDYRCGY
jgi:hypothetical protein